MRRVNRAGQYLPGRFQSTHPVWDATSPQSYTTSDFEFQSTHPVWDATRQFSLANPFKSISIHASRMGCDYCALVPGVRPANFNPRIPYGMRQAFFSSIRSAGIFQSTHPVWDATLMAFQRSYPIAYFNPRIPYGMRPSSYCACPSFSNFNPRIPYGMRRGLKPCRHGRHISIHASRMGCDANGGLRQTYWHHFNPRIPYGMRPVSMPAKLMVFIFQSTHPVWDATVLHVEPLKPP